MHRTVNIALVLCLSFALASPPAQGDACRTGFRLIGGFLGGVAGLVVDITLLGATAGSGTVIGASGGAAAGHVAGSAVCGKPVNLDQMEETTLRGVIEYCLDEMWSYSNPLPLTDDVDFCTIPINPFIHGEDEMGTEDGRQMDLIDVIRQFKRSFQLVSQQVAGRRLATQAAGTGVKAKPISAGRIKEVEAFTAEFADNLDECIKSYHDKFGMSRKGAHDWCKVTPTERTAKAWPGAKPWKSKKVTARTVIRAIRDALPSESG